MKSKLPWSRAEDLLLERFARELVSGRFHRACDAARACTDALERLHEVHPNAPWAAAARTYRAVQTRILKSVRAAGGRWPGGRWTPEEASLIRPFVARLVRGEYGSANEAARHALAVLEQNRRRAMPGRRPPPLFNPRTLEGKVRAEAKARGWRPDMREWSKTELRVLDGFGRALKRGQHLNATTAARAYLKEIDRLRRRYPRARWLKTERTLDGTLIKLIQRLKRLQAWSGALWPAQEVRLADRFAHRLIEGRYRSSNPAADDFLLARNALRDRSPEIEWLRRRRSKKSARRVILKRAHEMGWSKLFGRWAAPERLIMERYARAVARGEYPSVRRAAPACVREVANLHRQRPDASWSRLNRTAPAVENQLQDYVKALRIARYNGYWTPGELAILDRFARLVGTPGHRRIVDATKECLRELERRHRREMRRKPLLGPVQPRTFNAIMPKLRHRAIEVGTWGPYAGQKRVARRPAAS
jgi:hypothetical protein